MGFSVALAAETIETCRFDAGGTRPLLVAYSPFWLCKLRKEMRGPMDKKRRVCHCRARAVDATNELKRWKTLL